MGQERDCKLRYGGKAVAGKAYLETDYLLFRGEQQLKLIRAVEVIEAGRAAGLKDTKVARFSSTHTALRFVPPRAR